VVVVVALTLQTTLLLLAIMAAQAVAARLLAGVAQREVLVIRLAQVHHKAIMVALEIYQVLTLEQAVAVAQVVLERLEQQTHLEMAVRV